MSVLFLKDVSVVISVFSVDRANDVMNCIDSIKKQSITPKEIIVVLDPKEELVNFYREKLVDVKIVVSSDFGLSFARNMGVISSKYEIIAFIDDDAIADEKWLEMLVRNLEDSSVIGVGGRVEPVWDSDFPKWFPEELYWIVGCSYKGLPKRKAVIRNPIGCNMSFKRSVIEEAGYFNTNVGRIGNKLLGHDDTEFGIRVTEKFSGLKILYEPDAIVYHRVPKTRSTLKYVINRSFAEGFSKAYFSHNTSRNKSQFDIEEQYLQMLLISVPSKLFQLKLQTSFAQISTILISTLMVFLGYIKGLGSH
ncbi:MAG: glycosyltransferase family 2 protein [Candidatus Hodarchaeales archaeon]|jgi:glycosyltransferase involved in cell wall biosynthesis